MKKFLFSICFLTQLLISIGQRRPATHVTGTVTAAEDLAGLTVTIYDSTHFTGDSLTLGIGSENLSALDKRVSSIRVPKGLVAYLFEYSAIDKGYGLSADILEDVEDLAALQLSNKVSYIQVFAASKDNQFNWVRGEIRNGQYVAGHWERKRASGVLPANPAPAAVFNLPLNVDPYDISNIPFATEEEKAEFDQVRNNQFGVGILGGDSKRPFYYHHNQPGEEVYKYDKVIDESKLPAGLMGEASKKLGKVGLVLKPLEAATDLLGDLGRDIADFFGGSGSTLKKIDTWYPVSAEKQTVCGTMHEDAFICPQDYLHTKLTVDKDVCLELTPSEYFRTFLKNRWIPDATDHIEGEVKSLHLKDYSTETGKVRETLTPANPQLLQLKEGDPVCLYGPWMGDILDLNFNVPVPLTAEKIELGDVDIRDNNEIHPVNQLWRRKADELLLTAIVDGTGYFQKIGHGEIAASGLYQRMRFYVAFYLPPPVRAAGIVDSVVMDINAVGFDFTDNVHVAEAETIRVKNNGAVKLVVNDNSVVSAQQTHKLFLEKVKKRPDGSVQGYLVIETEPINKPGGSINIIVKTTSKGRPIGVFSEQ